MNQDQKQQKANFEFGNMTIDKLIEEYEEGILKIPRIQRNLVWTPKQKNDLQDTIKNKFPFGVILLSKVNEQKYIIDGLQRTTTIMEIYKNIFKNLLPKHLKDYVKSTVKEATLEFDNENIDNWNKAENLMIQLLPIPMNATGKIRIDSAEFGENFYKKHERKISEINILSTPIWKWLAGQIYLKANNSLDIQTYQIPYIIFKGSQEQTTTLFERINTKGTKLDKTDILRSRWSIIDMDFDESESKKMINEIDENLEKIASHSGGKYEKTNSLSPFDVIWYIFHDVLSNNISSHISGIFTKKISYESKTNKQIVGFDSLINLIKFHLWISEEAIENQIDIKDEEIGVKLKENIKSQDDVDTIISNLKKAIKIYYEIFHLFSNFRGNKLLKNDDSYLPGKSYTIAILGNIYNSIFEDKNLKINMFVSKNQARFRIRYIYDLISENFNSGSSVKAFLSMKHKFYLSGIDFENFESGINSFHTKSKSIEEENIFKEKSIILMYYLFMRDVNSHDNSSEIFENDHLIPKSKLKGFMGVTHFANLSLLKSASNRDKSDDLNIKYIHDDQMYRWALINNTNMAEKLADSYLVLCQNLNQATYYDFLDKRKDIILEMYKAEF
ncbi:MAG: DUF262 domain-containing protein [Mycoplasmataceae bacterium]|nr:DUF262 domain-containing protein [Mycoplasmataceae bacterium]